MSAYALNGTLVGDLKRLSIIGAPTARAACCNMAHDLGANLDRMIVFHGPKSARLRGEGLYVVAEAKQ